MIALLANRRYLVYACIAVAVAAVTSYTNFGHLCGDEYSQIFEFAGWKLGYVDHADLRLWEFDSAMRPSIQIWIVVGMQRLLGLFSGEADPFIVNYLIYFLSGLLAVFSITIFTGAFLERVQPRFRDALVIISYFTWIVLYSNCHFNSENISGHLLLLAVGLLYGSIEKTQAWLLMLTGIILGISFSCRFQIGFAIAGLLIWFLLESWNRHTRWQWVLLCVSLLASVLVFNVAADYRFYGRFVLSTYNYYFQNIATGSMDRNSGVLPWYAYIFLVSVYIPFGPAYVIATLNQCLRYRRDILTFVIAPFVLFHLLIGHKEVRFLLPLLGFMPVVMMVALEDFSNRWQFLQRHLDLFLRTTWILNLIPCLSLLIPAATEIGGWRYLHDHYPEPTLLYYNASVHQKLLYYRRHNLKIVDYKNGDPMPCPPGVACVLAVNANSKDPKPNLPRVYSFFPLGLDRLLPTFITRSIGRFDLYEVNAAPKPPPAGSGG